VNVLGTHFDVMAYADETMLRTTLLEGSVKVVDGSASGLLKPGQQAQVQGGDIKVVSANTANAVSWKNGFLTFEKADVPTVMRQIARWYDVDIAYEKSVPQKEFEGKIPMNAEIADLVKILETNDIHVKVDEMQRRLIVMP
jgi:ferric-dicitrate binding protein FerR (iron transport regulator)